MKILARWLRRVADRLDSPQDVIDATAFYARNDSALFTYKDGVVHQVPPDAPP